MIKNNLLTEGYFFISISCYNRFMKTTSPRPSPILGEGENSVIIYTDGSSLGNPGPGGYGCVIVFQSENKVIEFGGYDPKTTNNKMELTAIVTALNYLKGYFLNTVPHPNPPLHKGGENTLITIYTDSSYAINGITKWMFGWQKNNWITSTKTPVLNEELWKQFPPLTTYFKNLSFVHVRGHAGVWGNERCDTIATSFSRKTPISLFNGKLSDYDQEILSTKQNTAGEKKKLKTKSTEKAYSYVSLLSGKVEIHSTWEQCKARVHGKPAKYQKVFSKTEEHELIKKWKTL
jgi:ribonuclease HI